MARSLSLPLAALLALAALGAAQFTCRGFVSAPAVITSDLNVVGGSCTLSNVNVTGNVRVTNGGRLTTQGLVHISGCLHGFRAGDMNLGGRLTALGGVSVLESAATVTIGKNANAGTVSMTSVRTLVAFGTMSSLSVSESATVNVFGGRITGGGLIRRGGAGSTTLCGANIFGGVSLSMVSGNLVAVAGPNCGPITVKGTMAVSKGSGNVQISGGRFTATDVIVEEQEGQVSITNGDFSDVIVSRLKGSVRLQGVKLDSDTSITSVSQTVTMQGVRTEGDLKVERSNAVNLIRNNFGLEVVTVSGNSGVVNVDGNKDFSISLNENKGVRFHNNKVRFASVTKNSGSISVINNAAETLSCVDNAPAPTGYGNRIQLLSPGQCARLV